MAQSFTPPSVQQIYQSAVNNYTQMANYFGYNIVITPTDEIGIRLMTYASLVAVLYQYDNQLTNSKIIDTATGQDLDRVGNFLGFLRRTASSSQGAVTLSASVPQLLVAGSLLTGPNGLIFQVQTTGNYNPGQSVNVVSVSTGSSTNISTSSVMTWQAPSGTMQSTALVSVACTGGTDAEDDETFRGRIYLSVQAPPGMGNATQIITTASNVDSIIQQAFTYANFNGAGTQLIALTGYQTNSYIGRDIPHLPLDGFVNIYGTTVNNNNLQLQIAGGYSWGQLNNTPPYNPITNPQNTLTTTPGGFFNQYTLAANNFGSNLSNATASITGQLPATIANPFATTITTVNNVPANVAAVLTIPYPSGSQINGTNGGWLQSVPWPVPDGFYVNNYCAVTAITSSTVITISAPSSGIHNTTNPNVLYTVYNTQVPVAGQTQIQWVNRSDANQSGWTIITATVIKAVDNGNQTWTLTLDTPLVFATGSTDFYGNTGVAVGDFIFPASSNANTYLNNMMASFALLGPGEVTSNQGLLSLGAARYPGSNTSFPNVIAGPSEKLLESNNEVYNAQLNPGNGVVVDGITFWNCYNDAAQPPPLTSPPAIWVPHNLAFYPSESYNFGE